MEQKHKIIIDTNLWVSFLLTKRFDFLDELLSNGKIELFFCEELLLELLDVTSRPKLKKFFTAENWALIFEIIDQYGTLAQVVSSVTLCRDVKDNFLLSLAKDVNADYLLTGDKDLLILRTFETTEIITITEFQKIMADSSEQRS